MKIHSLYSTGLGHRRVVFIDDFGNKYDEQVSPKEYYEYQKEFEKSESIKKGIDLGDGRTWDYITDPDEWVPGGKMQKEHILQSGASHIKNLFEDMGWPRTDGTKDTPMRYVKAMDELTKGYREDIDYIMSRTFEEEHDEIVLVKDIGIISLCEHHLLPFFGRAHVAYIPNGKVLGLSKMVRLVRAYAQRLQLQERLTTEIADTMMRRLEPKGVGVIIEAQHMCMMIRGVKDMNALTTTSVMRGVFLNPEDNKNPKQEFMELIRR